MKFSSTPAHRRLPTEESDDKHFYEPSKELPKARGWYSAIQDGETYYYAFADPLLPGWEEKTPENGRTFYYKIPQDGKVPSQPESEKPYPASPTWHRPTAQKVPVMELVKPTEAFRPAWYNQSDPLEEFLAGQGMWAGEEEAKAEE